MIFMRHHLVMVKMFGNRFWWLKKQLKSVNVFVTATTQDTKTRLKDTHPIVITAITVKLFAEFIVLHALSVRENKVFESFVDKKGDKKGVRGVGCAFWRWQ